MRILIWMIHGDRIPGGHTIQAEQTAKALRCLGVEVVIRYDHNLDIGDFDIVHGFGLPLPCLRHCREQRIPVAFSTVYWSRDYLMGAAATASFSKKYARRARTALALSKSALQGRSVAKCEAIVRRLTDIRISYEMADLLLPNSEAEAKSIRDELQVTTPMAVVPNAVSRRFDVGISTKEKCSDILYVGRFEPHKNQLGLIKAMTGSPIPVRLIGPPHPDHGQYYETCKRLAKGNISILPAVPHEDLPQLYRTAKVHVLPSWFETTGLVSLEAALSGCNVVTTDRGYARDYFGDMAWYCNPGDSASIRNAIRAAHATPYRNELGKHILDHFTWEHTADATLQAYRRLCSEDIVKW